MFLARSNLEDTSFIIIFFLHTAAAAAKLLQSCLILCNPIDGRPLGSSVPGILQARILEWVAISFSKGSSRPRDHSLSLAAPALVGRFVTTYLGSPAAESLSRVRLCVTP